MKFLNFNKVLCLSPHPDDVEYSMLGTILKHTETQFDILCLTRGGAKGFDPTNKQDRLQEVKNVWKEASAANIKLLFSDCDYFQDKDGDAGWVNYIENNFLIDGSYNCIMLPTAEDSMFEHRFVNGLGYALTRVRPISLVEYHTPSTTNDWSPNIFIDIQKCFNKKVKSIMKFTSQTHKPYFSTSALDAFHSNFQCRKKNIAVVEQFRILELLSL